MEQALIYSTRVQLHAPSLNHSLAIILTTLERLKQYVKHDGNIFLKRSQNPYICVSNTTHISRIFVTNYAPTLHHTHAIRQLRPQIDNKTNFVK